MNRDVVFLRRSVSRRAILAGAPALLIPHCSQAALSSIPISLIIAPSSSPPPPSGWPGTVSNPVGYNHAPGYTGSLTPWPGGGFTNGTSGSPTVYAHYDFNGGSSGALNLQNASWITFLGCRFQSNNVSDDCSRVGLSGNILFSYCSFTPLASLYTAPPHSSETQLGQDGLAWPAAGAGLQTISQVTNTNCIDGSSGYQYGMLVQSTNTGPITLDHCDFWGFGNAITFSNSTNQINITNSWIHDGANSFPQGYHTDGPGYLDNTTPPQNVLLQGNTIASIGNTNAIALQAVTSPYVSISAIGNYLSGFNINTDFGHTANNNVSMTFENNVFGTDLPWQNGPFYADVSPNYGNGSGNLWRGNTLNILAGTSSWPGASPAWSGGQQGYYLLPNQTFSATDWTLGP